MTGQTEFSFKQSRADADLLTLMFQKADRILIKKLSNNDRDWAQYSNKHQGGIYIPKEERDGGFFPALELKNRTDGKTDKIRERYFETIWQQFSGEERCSRLVNYTSKGQETHLTGVPNVAFAELLPASFLVMGRIVSKEIFSYQCLTISSESEEATFLAELFDLKSDFLIGVFEPATVKAQERDRILDFADQVISAWQAGKIDAFAKNNATMPSTTELAQMALAVFLKEHRLERINPFVLDAPGDVLREISRTIEWGIFREYQRRERSVELVRLLLDDNPRTITASDIIRGLIDQFAAIDALMLSASQQRKSRAGYSYEHHIETMLTGGNIPFEKQVVIEAKKRPDFILPSLKFINSSSENAGTGLILSAKTTLRERWKQVEREKGDRRLFLTTVDENIAGNAIEDMASFGVHLVIPESLKVSKLAEYSGHKNVLSFKEFCVNYIQPNLRVWL